VRKLQPKEINDYCTTEQFSVSLDNPKGNKLEVMIDDNLIIQNSKLYYEIVDGPMNVDWLIQFFIHNHQ